MAAAFSLHIVGGDGVTSLSLGSYPDGARPPRTLEHIRAVVGEGPARLDERMIEQIVTSFDLPDGDRADLTAPVRVWQFLRRHEGEVVCLVDMATSSTPAGAKVSPDGPRAAPQPELRPWQTAAGVAAWRTTLANHPDSRHVRPTLPLKAATWAIAATIIALVIALVIALHLLAVGAPGLAAPFALR